MVRIGGEEIVVYDLWDRPTYLSLSSSSPPLIPCYLSLATHLFSVFSD